MNIPDNAPLLFVDTNIFLDGYRAGYETTLGLLMRLNDFCDNLITTDQVEMEFLKNRQEVIRQTLKAMKMPEKFGQIPQFLGNAKKVKMIRKDEKRITDHINNIRDRVEKVLAEPSRTDPVFKIVRRLFKRSAPGLNLKRPNKQRYEIRALAAKRWQLGYPPRKNNDSSIGDAINWEWIIDCARRLQKDVLIVSRDGDYGRDDQLNDWLREEFKARVGRRRKVSLTAALGQALKLLDENIPADTVRKEREEISDGLTILTSAPSGVPAADWLVLERFYRYRDMLRDMLREMRSPDPSDDHHYGEANGEGPSQGG